MHFPLEEQIEFLKSVAILTKGTVVFSQSLSTPYQRTRRRVKKLLHNAGPAAYPITEDDVKQMLDGACLPDVTRFRLGRLTSDAMFLGAAPTSPRPLTLPHNSIRPG